MLSAHRHISADHEQPPINDIAPTMPHTFESPLSYPEIPAELWMADHRDRFDPLRFRRPSRSYSIA
jgi:hypothetical protein